MILLNSIIEVWNRERLFRGSGQKKTTESEMLSEPWLHLSASSQVTSFSIWFQAIKGWLFVYWLFLHVWNLNATHLGAGPCFSSCLLASFPPTHGTGFTCFPLFSHWSDGVKYEKFRFNLCFNTSSIKKEKKRVSCICILLLVRGWTMESHIISHHTFVFQVQ